jgi:hypothetical protein
MNSKVGYMVFDCNVYTIMENYISVLIKIVKPLNGLHLYPNSTLWL